MSYEQVRDILNKTKELHRELSRFYEVLESRCKQQKVKLLLDYLHDRESKGEKQMEQFIREAEDSLMNAYYSFTPDQQKWNFLKEIEISPDASLQEAIDMVLKIDQYILDLLQEVAENSELDHVRLVFVNMLEHAKKERNRFVRDAMMLEEC